VYCKLVNSPVADWKGRAHFFAVAAQSMRRILVDHARSRRSARRGAGIAHVSIDSTAVFSEDRLDDLLILEDALDALERVDPRALQVVTMRFYGGLSTEEVAEVLQVSVRTVKRDWNFGRIWLKAHLAGSPNLTQ
jgi:RNA polymerase sigma factor (TIGR02999 family)